jgi:hypothetical protein
MAILPVIFVILPMIQLFAIPAAASSAKLDTRIGLSLGRGRARPAGRSGDVRIELRRGTFAPA